MKRTVVAISIALFFCQQGLSASNYDQVARKILTEAPHYIHKVMDEAELYDFNGRFIEGQEGVSFSQEVLHHLLIGGLKSFMGSLKRGGYPGSREDAERAMMDYFQYHPHATQGSPGSTYHNTVHGAKLMTLHGERMNAQEGRTYGDVQRFLETESPASLRSWRSLSDVMAQGELKGIGSDMFPGVNLLGIDADGKGDSFVEAEDVMTAIVQIVATNATEGMSFTVPNGELERQRIQDAVLTEDGVNLKEISNKLIHGAIPFFQASAVLLGNGLNADNLEPMQTGGNYTALEHNWDRAFGYFGAARDFSLYSDEQARKKLAMDSNRDNLISLYREKNLGIAVNTSRIDLTASTRGEGGVDLSGQAISGFIYGRALIAQRPSQYLQYARANAVLAISAWEKAVGGIVIHYLNSTLKIMDVYGTTDYSFYKHAKYWSEMKGYGLAFQFNPNSSMNMVDFEKLHQLIGDRPVLMTASDEEIAKYKASLLQARDILKNAFDFSQVNTEAL